MLSQQHVDETFELELSPMASHVSAMLDCKNSAEVWPLGIIQIYR